MSKSLLAQIRALPGITIDVDSMDPTVASRHTPPFCDMTSNQAIVYGQASRDDYKLVKLAIKQVLSEASSSDQASDTFAQDVVDLLVCADEEKYSK